MFDINALAYVACITTFLDDCLTAAHWRSIPLENCHLHKTDANCALHVVPHNSEDPFVTHIHCYTHITYNIFQDLQAEFACRILTM